jgi:hypothetical protein
LHIRGRLQNKLKPNYPKKVFQLLTFYDILLLQIK